jgi:subtilisin family serine protease
VLADNGTGESTWVVQGIEWGISEGAQVISMSLGSPLPDEAIREAIQKAVAAGVFVTTGNTGHP